MKKTAISTLVLTSAVSLSAWADTYLATNWMSPVHILNEQPYQKLASELAEASNGDFRFEVYSSGALVPAKTTLQGIRDGVAQLGVVYPGYTPSELPVNNVLNDLVFTSSDALAAALAYTEMGINHAALKDEWLNNGGLFLGGYSTPVYNFICMDPVVNPDDVQGRKIRTAGGAQTEWIRSLGGVPVSVPIGDVYSGLSRGSIDCTLSDPTNLDKGNKFWEVAESVTTLPMGVVMGATYVLNPRFWQSLDTDYKELLLDHLAMGLARTQVTYAADVEAALAGSRERGLEVLQPSDAFQATLAAFQEDFISTLPEQAMEDRGVDDPSAMIEEFLDKQTQWSQRLSEVDRTDPAAIAQLISEEIYDKIELDSFVN
ncbi:C4-dicarboxylate TRAP transporter substrate-binding protein [Halomonas icarae]|uniref:C4-dicarboxylate ABC transporter substrate-binding protein n=1 Tax=Halomonas icarae TaxID=2691040 RepID=A0A7X5AMN1_9GAMM|nr:C4-dicarboxylate TRAP transporter substrate-binding protein [Halomonas icarae]MDR5903000.1 C4-dicarboxylate TRAP transporter substrate-binding protein [Halomonas icarae]NAW13575.1 C4-dicarboxylate ABC transporter substrate-binding protein [Halomonas icarae]